MKLRDVAKQGFYMPRLRYIYVFTAKKYPMMHYKPYERLNITENVSNVPGRIMYTINMMIIRLRTENEV